VSENVFSNQQYEDMFAELENSSDKELCLQGLADRFSTQTKNLKNGIKNIYPDEYSEWFGASVKADSKELTKKELVDRLIEIIDYPQEKWEHIRSTVAKSSFPQPFAQQLYKQLVDNKLDAYIEELEWLKRATLKRWLLVWLIIFTIFVNNERFILYTIRFVMLF